MRVGVLGGTGRAGGPLTLELARRGHEAIALSRHAPADGAHRHADVVSGEGLDAAMDGLDALVDVLDGPPAVLVDGLGRALASAASAGVGRVLSLSILGCDRVPMGYYRVKVAQERVLRDSGLDWDVLRATQFHSLLDFAFGRAARRGVLPLARVPLQPVDVAEVAGALADLVEREPGGRVHHFAGPRIERADRLARAWARARSLHRLPLPVPAVGRTLRAVAAGRLTDPQAAHGAVGFAEWLRS